MTNPFLKWAGGKRWFVKGQHDFFPLDYNRYIEPFVGSGAVYFFLEPKRAIISDSNPELIVTYRAIRDNHKAVEEFLKEYQCRHSEAFYYKMRSHAPSSVEETAARMIYLNRTCWNGLYRVNRQGVFNVPKGTKSNVLLDSDDFSSLSSLLRRSDIFHSDFEPIIDRSKSNDFLFLDPPYTVRHNNNGFVKYNEKLFSWDDQLRLKSAIDRAVARGAKVLMTNANHDSVWDLYCDDYNCFSVSRSSVISGKKEFRGAYSELIVSSF